MSADEEDTVELDIKVEGMMCGGCTSRVEEALKASCLLGTRRPLLQRFEGFCCNIDCMAYDIAVCRSWQTSAAQWVYASPEVRRCYLTVFYLIPPPNTTALASPPRGNAKRCQSPLCRSQPVASMCSATVARSPRLPLSLCGCL